MTTGKSSSSGTSGASSARVSGSAASADANVSAPAAGKVEGQAGMRGYAGRIPAQTTDEEKAAGGEKAPATSLDGSRLRDNPQRGDEKEPRAASADDETDAFLAKRRAERNAKSNGPKEGDAKASKK